MKSLERRFAATVVREVVTSLSARLSSDYGTLVAEASTTRTAALIARLEDDADGIRADELATLDAWIRLADSAVLRDDRGEVEARSACARRLRDVRAAVAPEETLTPDPRDT